MTDTTLPADPPKLPIPEWLSKYWALIFGLGCLLYTGVIRDDKAQRAATDFYAFAQQQVKTNQDNAVTNQRLTTLLEDQSRRLTRLEDRKQ